MAVAVVEDTEPVSAVGPTTVQQALRHIFETDPKGYESLVKILTGHQQRCLRALARIGGRHPQSKAFLAAAGIAQPSSVKRALIRLADPFFQQWVAQEL